jgi:hypothetical protein
MKAIPLGVSVATMAVGVGIVVYIRRIKRKLKRFVLRNDEVTKYYKD